jgi:hypothetical protein
MKKNKKTGSPSLGDDIAGEWELIAIGEDKNLNDKLGSDERKDSNIEDYMKFADSKFTVWKRK